jgi:hypothetical protein
MIYFVIITLLQQLIPSQTPEQFSKLPCSTISYAVNLINFKIITLIYYITKQRVCETISIIKMLQTKKINKKKLQINFIRQFGSVFNKKKWLNP